MQRFPKPDHDVWQYVTPIHVLMVAPRIQELVDITYSTSIANETMAREMAVGVTMFVQGPNMELQVWQFVAGADPHLLYDFGTINPKELT